MGQTVLQAAGHEGIFQDESGLVIVKPSNEEEVKFYEDCNLKYSLLKSFIPKFMGTLTQDYCGELASQFVEDDSKAYHSEGHIEGSKNETLSSLDLDVNSSQNLNKNSKKFKENQSDIPNKLLVLDNLTYGYKLPCIIDIKLGKVLSDPINTSIEKRHRLESVASSTTSGSLGFRIAGMRVCYDESKYKNEIDRSNNDSEEKIPVLDYKDLDGKVVGKVKVYDRFYGRQFREKDVILGLQEYLLGAPKEYVDKIVDKIYAEIKEIKRALEKSETRMYSVSLLIIYEGDVNEIRKKIDWEKERKEYKEDTEDQEDEDDDDEDQDVHRDIALVKLIDFAHSSFTPGLGKDENILYGLENLLEVFSKIQTATC